MLMRILTNSWFALLAVLIAASSVGLLYYRGKEFEALVGGGVLLLAIIFIVIGIRQQKKGTAKEDQISEP
jgi:hypothetical protein